MESGHDCPMKNKTQMQVRVPKPATKWHPEASLLASRIVVWVTNASQNEAEKAWPGRAVQ
jgi:hypothetical protein